VSYGW